MTRSSRSLSGTRRRHELQLGANVRKSRRSRLCGSRVSECKTVLDLVAMAIGARGTTPLRARADPTVGPTLESAVTAHEIRRM
jgi:hypothetical protein